MVLDVNWVVTQGAVNIIYFNIEDDNLLKFKAQNWIWNLGGVGDGE
jgi:hypothetical protein